VVTSASLLQTVLALGFVLLLIVAVAWAFRRMQRPGGAWSPLQIRGQLMVGPRERVVLIEVGDQWIVAGVASGSVQPLAVMPRQDVDDNSEARAAGAVPNFGALLERLSRKTR